MISWLEQGLRRLNPEVTKDKNGGYTRLGYSDEEQIAIRGFIELAKELNLNVRRDAAGNVIATWSGTDPNLPVIAFGSHVDTVKQGGAYDGPAGVLAALGVVKILQEEGFISKRSIEVICFASEESSRFGVSTLGSKAMAGLLKLDDMIGLVDEKGKSVEEAFSSQGLDLFKVKSANRLPSDGIHSFVELHIEQGTVLEDAGDEIGVVLAIATPLRYQIKIEGQASHTGTTLMGKRKDALAAAAQLVAFVEATGIQQAENGHLVATVSVANVEPNVMNVIPQTVNLGIDIRSTDDTLKNETGELIQNFCKILEDQRQLKFQIKELDNTPSVLMNENVIDRLTQAVKRTEKKGAQLNSGAGHDAMNMAKRWSTGMIFIPCKNGLSHHPDEHADVVNILNGTQVLVEYVKMVDQSP